MEKKTQHDKNIRTEGPQKGLSNSFDIIFSICFLVGTSTFYDSYGSSDTDLFIGV